MFAAASSARMSYGTVYDTNINKVIVVFSDAANSSYPTGVIGAVSGTTITFSSETTFESAYNIHPSTVFDSTNNKLIIGQAGNSTVDGAALVVGPPVYTQVTTYNTTNFIGVAAAAISDTATGSINIMGSVNESLTSLTVGAKYYLQVNGTIATTATDKEIGRAIASTKLLITSAGNVQIDNDSGKFELGADQDISFYHTGTHGFLENDTGTFYIKGDTISLNKADGNNVMWTNGSEFRIYPSASTNTITVNVGMTTAGGQVAPLQLEFIGSVLENSSA